MLQYDTSPFVRIEPETNVEYNEHSNVGSHVSMYKYYIPFCLL